MIPMQRLTETYTAWYCTDCDPDGDEEQEYDKPFVFLMPADEHRPDHCPRCGSYLSLDVEMLDIVLTRKPIA